MRNMDMVIKVGYLQRGHNQDSHNCCEKSRITCDNEQTVCSIAAILGGSMAKDNAPIGKTAPLNEDNDRIIFAIAARETEKNTRS